MQSETSLWSQEPAPGNGTPYPTIQAVVDDNAIEEEIVFEKSDNGESDLEPPTFVSSEDTDHGSSVDNVPTRAHEQVSTKPELSDTRVLRTRAVWAMLFCILTDAINLQCTAPNYPLMVSPGAHPDSFPQTEPLDFASAQYMIMTAAKTGAFLANLGAGWLSDHVGRRRLVMINLLGSIVFTMGKFAARNHYWAFVGMAFGNGCFASTMAVGLGYMAELFVDDRVKGDAFMGHSVAAMVVGRSAGGLLAVVTPNSLFFPLILATIISAIGLVAAYFLLIEPSELRDPDEGNQNLGEEPGVRSKKRRKSSYSIPLPPKIDMMALVNVVGGSLIGNIGSIGLISLSLTPLMFETFHFDFVEDGMEPVMSEQTYRVLYSMAAIIVVPGALLSPWFFRTLGVALSNVLANIFAACVVVSLLYISMIEPVTRTTFAVYVTVLYLGYALSVTSNLATGPMLDRITPLHKKGLVQGINGALYDGSYAIFPFLYALLVDHFGIFVALWTSTGICCLSALVNLPLVFHPRMQAEKEDEEDSEDQLDVTGSTAFISTDLDSSSNAIYESNGIGVSTSGTTLHQVPPGHDDEDDDDDAHSC